jgi:hypothetical protein
MICQACGRVVVRLDHVVHIDGGVYCRELIEESYGSVDEFVRQEVDPTHEDEDIGPIWFGGTLDESGEVYGG